MSTPAVCLADWQCALITVRSINGYNSSDIAGHTSSTSGTSQLLVLQFTIPADDSRQVRQQAKQCPTRLPLASRCFTTERFTGRHVLSPHAN